MKPEVEKQKNKYNLFKIVKKSIIKIPTVTDKMKNTIAIISIH